LAGGLDLGPDGSLYIADTNNHRVRQVKKLLPSAGVADLAIPSEDGKRIYGFDASGRHLNTLNPLTGAVIHQFQYDPLGRLAQLTDGNGNITLVERDAIGNPTAIVGPLGQRTHLGLNANGYLEAITNPASETYRFSYTADGLLSSVTTPKGDNYLMIYDDLGRLIRAEDPVTGTNALALTALENGAEVTLATGLGRISTYRTERFSSGQRRSVRISPDATLSRLETSPDGTSVITAAADGSITAMLLGAEPRFGMQSPLLKDLRITTPGGLAYNAAIGRTVNLTDANDLFSLAGQTETMTVNGRTYTANYDGPTKTFTDTTPEGRRATATINNLGRITKRQIAGLLPRSYGYDARGRLNTLTLGTGEDARVTTFTYSSDSGYMETMTDPLGRIVRFESDAVGRITKRTLPGNREVLYRYDANGNLISVTPPGKPEHAFKYTSVDLPSEYIAPQVGSENSKAQYFFNLDRQPRRMLWPDGLAMEINYDGGGRVSALMPDNQRGYTYDASSGKLALITSPGQALAFSYDGHLLANESWSRTIAGNVGRTYNNDFNIASISINGGNTIEFLRDNDSLLIRAGDLNLTRNSQNGLITGTVIENVTDARGYNGFGEMSSYSAAIGGTNIYSAEYTRDKLGRITGTVETLAGVSDTYAYIYDLAGRLTEVKKNGMTSAQYTYDANGNRLSSTIMGHAVEAAYDDQDRLTQYGNTTYTYSGKGELQAKTAGGQTITYQYDSLGNLTSVAVSGGTRIDYVIDGSNRRVGKKINGTLTKGFLYENRLKPIAELDGDGNILSFFVYGSKANIPDYMVKEENTYRIVSDHLGSPRIVVDVATGTVAQQMDYDEFGNVVLDTLPGFQPFGFAGGLYDPDTGLIQFGARDYDPETGRWITKDPIGLAGAHANLYAYVENDPVNLIDPTGLKGGNAAAPVYNPAIAAPPVLIGATPTEYEQLYNTMGDFLYNSFIQEGYDPWEAQALVNQWIMDNIQASHQPGLNLPPNSCIESRRCLGTVLGLMEREPSRWRPDSPHL
jgi:RHS repeat-associated protein